MSEKNKPEKLLKFATLAALTKLGFLRISDDI
jgi:hypothetical protein